MVEHIAERQVCERVVFGMSFRGEIPWSWLNFFFDYSLGHLAYFASTVLLAILPLRLALFEAGRMRDGVAKAV